MRRASDVFCGDWRAKWGVAILCSLVGLVSGVARCAADEWPRWRGPLGNGIAADQSPPLTWSATENVRWRFEIPGRGHSSPLVVGNRIFLTTADESQQTQSVLCYHWDTGARLWETVINEGGFNPRIHPNNTHASPTVATDGERVFAVVNHHEAIYVTALDRQGAVLWQQRAGEFGPARYHFGFGASPVVYRDTVIVTGDTEKDPFLVAYDVATGQERWRTRRPSCTSYSTPVVVEQNGREWLVLSGGRAVTAYDPTDGRPLWQAPASWDVSCGTVVWDGDLLFMSGGFPTAQTLAIRADGTGHVVWENGVKCYEQSMLAHDGYVYGHADQGVVFCWRGSDGQEMWKGRLEGPVSVSPILANGHLYFTSERGTTFVVRADPTAFEIVAKNKLGDSAFASPAVVEHCLLMRVGVLHGDRRQEYLYCLGAAARALAPERTGR